jgi:hypothetical protein
MNSSAKVGKIFTEAGASFHKLADMTVMLEPAAAELHELNQKHSQVNSKIISRYILFFEK